MKKIILVSIMMVGSLVADIAEVNDGFEELNESVVVEEKYEINGISNSSSIENITISSSVEAGEEIAGENDKSFEVTDEYIRKAIAELETQAQ